MGIRTIQRKEQIRAMIRDEGRLAVADLVRRLGVSRVTARRYLEELEKDGVLVRTYGGAVKPEPATMPGFSFTEKAGKNQAAKAAIARRALGLVSPGETVFLDSGTTVLELARLLGGTDSPLSAATPSLPAAMELLRNRRIQIMVLGGFLRRELLDLFGPFSTEEIMRLSFSQAFLGVDGISARAGLTTTDLPTAQLEETVMRKSGRITILADHDKIGRVTLIPYGDLARPGKPVRLVTDRDADAGEIAALRGRGLEVIVADGPAGGQNGTGHGPGL